MHRSLFAESHTVELPAMLSYELDPNVLEYFAQPMVVNAETTKGNWNHTPDFLILRNDGVVVEEWRMEKRLQKLSASQPERYTAIPGGSWTAPVMEEFFANYGIRYELSVPRKLNPQKIENQDFLRPYYSPDFPIPKQEDFEDLINLLAEYPIISLQDLVNLSTTVEEAGGQPTDRLFSTDDLYWAIAHGHVVVDLERDSLAERHRTYVFRDAAILQIYQSTPDTPVVNPSGATLLKLEIGSTFLFDDIRYRITLAGEAETCVTSDENVSVSMSTETLVQLYQEGKITPLLVDEKSDFHLVKLPSTAQVEVYNARRCAIDAYQRGNHVQQSARTIQRWSQAISECASINEKVLALVPKKKPGNTTTKLSEDVLAAIKNIRDTVYNQPGGGNKNAAYRKFLIYCADRKICPCSKKSFNNHIVDGRSLLIRDGRRIEYQQSPIVLYLDATAPIHGVRPFQIVHIDHTPLELLIHNLEYKEIATTVWLSLAIDANSRAIVGFFLSTQHPSYRSCMMVLRDIVRRHGRMPDCIVVDNGPDFQSNDFKRVCQTFECNIKYRPRGQPRFGTVIERVFLTTQTELIHTLKANLRLRKKPRELTKKVNPENFVEWTLPALHGSLDMYFCDLYGAKEHPAHGEKPIRFLKMAMAEVGLRNNKLVKLDKLFLIETCPSVEGKTRSLDKIRGVKIKNYWYWNDSFKKSKKKNQTVAVRVDPWDPRYCYVDVDGEWVMARSKLVGELKRCTDLELQYAVAVTGKKFLSEGRKMTPELLEKWNQVGVAENFDPRIAAVAKEELALYERLGIGSVEKDNAAALDARRSLRKAVDLPPPVFTSTTKDIDAASPGTHMDGELDTAANDALAGFKLAKTPVAADDFPQLTPPSTAPAKGTKQKRSQQEVNALMEKLKAPVPLEPVLEREHYDDDEYGYF
jgi:putative transposase